MTPDEVQHTPRTWCAASLLLLAAIASPAGAQESSHAFRFERPAEPASSSGAVALAESTPQPDAGAAHSIEDDGSRDLLLDPHYAWTIHAEPIAWWVSPSGKIKLPGAGASDRVFVSDLNLDTPRVSPAGELQIRADRFSFNFSASAFSLERDDTTADDAFTIGDVGVTPGDALDVDFDFATYQFTVGYRFDPIDLTGRSDDPASALDAVLAIELLAGARATDIGLDVRSGSSASSADQIWLEPIIGARVDLRVLEQLSVDLGVSAGGFSTGDASSASLDIDVAFRYHPTDNVGVEFGWRQLGFALSDGSGDAEFEYDGRMAGVYAGVVIRFWTRR